MSKHHSALAGALSILLLSSCGSQEPAAAQNNAAAVEVNGLESASPSDPAQPATPATPATPANGLDDPVPPPDAVSHPDGYLATAPGQAQAPGANSSGPKESPPATEDEYIRNGQAAR